jgi:uncharacterized iron-regulated protein
MRRRWAILGGVALACAAAALAAPRPQAGAAEPACLAHGAWGDAGGRPIGKEAALAAAAGADVVLLGETHGEAAHHAWQGEMLAALADLERPVMLGVEYLPRSAQPLLDAYAAGGLDEASFLAGVNWDESWGVDFAAYRPLFEAARARGLPIIALNIERAFIRRVAREGFAAAAAADGQNGAPISAPAPATDAYKAMLKTSFERHGKAPNAAAFARFVDAQQSWDRAMAETIAQALSARPGARIVATMGSGHVVYGHGVGRQLDALGVTSVFSALPLSTDAKGCAAMPGAADAFFRPAR